MKMRIFVFLAIVLCACASETPETESTDAAQVKEKRQSQEGTLTHHAVYRQAKSPEQVAPVMETQDDVTLRNRTSLQPESEDQGETVERPAREKPDDAPDSAKDENKIDEPVVNSDASNTLPQSQPQVEIQNNGLGDQQKYDIPPPRDGKSYTPEEFTSLIVSGYAITPVPDYGFSLGGRSLPVGFGGFPSTIRPPIPFTPGPFPGAPLTPNPYFSRALPVSSTIAPALLGLREQSKIGQGQLPLNFEQQREGQRSLPPPKNNKAYSVEEFNNLLAAGYAVTPVPVAPLSLDVSQTSRHEAEEYRPGQVFSLNPRELLELQPERKAPLASNQLLQQLYGNPQQEHKQNLQPFYFLEPQSQSGRQVPPSHAVIARPHFSFNGGEASVGAALSVSDNGANHENFDQELLALLGQAQIRPQEPRPTQATSSVSPQYQQVDRYVAKPGKKSSKIRAKVHSAPPQTSVAPQQYLIETTNIEQQQQQQPQYRPTPQPQRLAQSLRYVPIQSQSAEQFHYERPESQGIKVVPAPKLQQQSRAQYNYRLPPQLQQQEASPKQYRILELPRAQPIRQELRLPASGLEKSISYLKRYPELEKQRSVKIYDPVGSEGSNQQAQLFGDQFVLRQVYRPNDQRPRYELSPVKTEQPRASESTKPPHSAIYVSKNLPAPRQQKSRQQNIKIDQPSNLDYINIEQHGQSIDEQRSQLPPPKNNKAYTPEEFAALVAAGYSVTPVPVSSFNLDVAQSRSTLETVTAQPKRRLTQRRRNQYLPVRDDAP